MKKDDYCSGCGQKDTCRLVYEKLGKVVGPNLAAKAIVAFLVPIGVFVGSLAAVQQLLCGRFEGNTRFSQFFSGCMCNPVGCICDPGSSRTG